MKSTCQKRRILLKAAVAASAVGAITSTGLSYAQPASKPVWPKEAFNASSFEEALLNLTGSNAVIPSPDDIMIKAPTIAEDGIAHITIQSRLPGTESISIFIPNNASPLVANFRLHQKITNTITTRIKIETSGEIIAVIHANNRLYSATKKIRTTTSR